MVLSAPRISVPLPSLLNAPLPPTALVMPKLVPAATLKLPARAQRGGARRVERRGRGQRAAVERQRARQGAHVAVLRDLQRAAVDAVPPGGIDPRQHQRAQVGLDQLGRAGQRGGDGGGIAGAARRAIAHADHGLVRPTAHGHADQRQRIQRGVVHQRVAVGGELHALGQQRTVDDAVHADDAALPHEHGEGALGPRRVQRAVHAGPVVIGQRAVGCPDTRPAIDRPSFLGPMAPSQ